MEIKEVRFCYFGGTVSLSVHFFPLTKVAFFVTILYILFPEYV